MFKRPSRRSNLPLVVAHRHSRTLIAEWWLKVFVGTLAALSALSSLPLRAAHTRTHTRAVVTGVKFGWCLGDVMGGRWHFNKTQGWFMVHPEPSLVTKEHHPLWLLILFPLNVCVCVCVCVCVKMCVCDFFPPQPFWFPTLFSSSSLLCLSEMKTHEDTPWRVQCGFGSVIKNLEVKRTLKSFTPSP